jgi:hypothetical protein
VVTGAEVSSDGCSAFMTLSRLAKTPLVLFDTPLRAPTLPAAAPAMTPYSTIDWPAAGPSKTTNNAKLLTMTEADRIVIDPPSVQLRPKNRENK